MQELESQFEVSQRRACRVVGQPRSSQRYASKPRDDEPALAKRMVELAGERPRFGYRRIANQLRQEQWRVSDTRVYRLWRREGLKVPQKSRKRRRLGDSRNSCTQLHADHKNHVWCWDFAFDRTHQGSMLKWLAIVDEHTRECLSLKVSRNITSEDVIDILAELFAERGAPEGIRSDNGPEMTSNAIREWLKKVGVKPLYIEPGSPWQNGYTESFFSRFRDEFLATEEFENLQAAQSLTKAWRHDYNHQRPHSSLGYLPPAEFANRCAVSAPASATPPPALQRHTDPNQSPTT